MIAATRSELTTTNRAPLVPQPRYPFKLIERGKNDTLIRIDYSAGKIGYFKVSTAVARIVAAVDGQRNLAEITQWVNNRTTLELTIDEAYQVLYEGLAKLFTPGTEVASTPSYLRLRTTMLNRKRVRLLTEKLRYVFRNPYFVYGTFAASLVFLIGFFAFGPEVALRETPLLFVPLTMGLSLISHELGHAAACRAYGAEAGEIGFGFYLFTPVLYSNVTDAWQLSRSQRVVVDMAGMFMETGLASLAVVIFLVTGHPAFYVIAGAVFFNTIININPLLRYDGYWILSDLTETPNLRAKSNQLLGQAVGALRHGEWEWFAKIDKLLLGYAMASLLFQIWFLYFISFYYFAEVLALPVNAGKLLLSMFNLAELPTNFSVFTTILLPLFFYLLVWNFLKKAKLFRYVNLSAIQIFSRG